MKHKNEIFARHVLVTRCQEHFESFDQFIQELKLLGKDYNFKTGTAAEAADKYVRNAFVNEMSSNVIRQWVLENNTLYLETAYKSGHTLVMAYNQSSSYSQSQVDSITASAAVSSAQFLCVCGRVQVVEEQVGGPGSLSAAVTPAGPKCSFCGYSRYPRPSCPAKEAIFCTCKKRVTLLKFPGQGDI